MTGRVFQKEIPRDTLDMLLITLARRGELHAAAVDETVGG